MQKDSQFYIIDKGSPGRTDSENFWSEEAHNSRLAMEEGISATKMNRYRNRMQNDGNRSRSTQSRNERLFNENSVNHANYMKALAGVKTVNDAYKSFGVEALQRIDLYKIVPR